MNTNPNAKRILCYGDSNTWGQNPKTWERFKSNERWTGILQELLGSEFEIIEEGLCGRSADNIFTEDQDLNGLQYFLPCFKSHWPLDLIILYLGTNDLDSTKTAQEIANTFPKYISEIHKVCDRNNFKLPKVLIVAPVPIDEGISEESKLSRQLPEAYREMAEKNNLDFINLSESVEVSKIDGIHLDSDAHKKIAEVIYQKIK